MFFLICSWQLATGGWRLAAGNWRLAAGNWHLAARGFNVILIQMFKFRSPVSVLQFPFSSFRFPVSVLPFAPCPMQLQPQRFDILPITLRTNFGIAHSWKNVLFHSNPSFIVLIVQFLNDSRKIDSTFSQFTENATTD